MKEVAAIFVVIGLIVGLAIDLSKPDGSECLKIAAKLDTTGSNTSPLVSCVVNVGVWGVIGAAFSAVIVSILAVFGGLLGG
jgi:hypothetical protein